VANHWGAGLTTHDLRAIAAYSISALVLFPLSFYEHIHGLWWVVVLAIVSVVWTSGIVASEGIQAYVTPVHVLLSAYSS
jgi:hypothetical protein